MDAGAAGFDDVRSSIFCFASFLAPSFFDLFLEKNGMIKQSGESPRSLSICCNQRVDV